MRLIIVLRGHHPSTHPHHIGGFEWSPEHECYVWQGRELRPVEFNDVIDGVLKANRDLWAHPVTVRVVGGGRRGDTEKGRQGDRETGRQSGRGQRSELQSDRSDLNTDH